jgi:DNA-binding Lrp family transcriptional regulator
MIVVDGEIFEAFFDESSQNMRVEARRRVRCHWRGARSWNLHATIDVVSLDHLDDFLKTRAQEVITVLEKLQRKRNEIAACFEEKSLDRLNLTGKLVCSRCGGRQADMVVTGTKRR